MFLLFTLSNSGSGVTSDILTSSGYAVLNRFGYSDTSINVTNSELINSPLNISTTDLNGDLTTVTNPYNSQLRVFIRYKIRTFSL